MDILWTKTIINQIHYPRQAPTLCTVLMFTAEKGTTQVFRRGVNKPSESFENSMTPIKFDVKPMKYFTRESSVQKHV